MFFQLRICLLLLVGVAGALSAGQVNAVILYQEDFEFWTPDTPLETVMWPATLNWLKNTSFDSVEVTNTHGTLDGNAIDGSTQDSPSSQYSKYTVAIGGMTGLVAQTLTVDMYTTANSFENLFGYAPGLSFAAGPGGWEFRSPGNAAVPMGGVAGLDTRVSGLISVTGDGPGNSIHAEMRRASDNSLLGSANVTSDTTGYLSWLLYWQHEGRSDRLGFDIDNILLVDGFINGGEGAGDGDFDMDGDVDAADYTRWRDNLGLDSSVLSGNGSGAATVVQADYLLWKTNFEALATGSEGTAAVPEPTSGLLLAFGVFALSSAFRRKFDY